VVSAQVLQRSPSGSLLDCRVDFCYELERARKTVPGTRSVQKAVAVALVPLAPRIRSLLVVVDSRQKAALPKMESLAFPHLRHVSIMPPPDGYQISRCVLLRPIFACTTSLRSLHVAAVDIRWDDVAAMARLEELTVKITPLLSIVDLERLIGRSSRTLRILHLEHVLHLQPGVTSRRLRFPVLERIHIVDSTLDALDSVFGLVLPPIDAVVHTEGGVDPSLSLLSGRSASTGGVQTFREHVKTCGIASWSVAYEGDDILVCAGPFEHPLLSVRAIGLRQEPFASQRYTDQDLLRDLLVDAEELYLDTLPTLDAFISQSQGLNSLSFMRPLASLSSIKLRGGSSFELVLRFLVSEPGAQDVLLPCLKSIHVAECWITSAMGATIKNALQQRRSGGAPISVLVFGKETYLLEETHEDLSYVAEIQAAGLVRIQPGDELEQVMVKFAGGTRGCTSAES
jgi:hypothetical protein